MVHDDVFKCLNQWSSNLRNVLLADVLHGGEELLPNEVNVDLHLLLINLLLLVLVARQLGDVIRNVHEHANGSEIWIDIIVILFGEAFEAIYDLNEVILA